MQPASPEEGPRRGPPPRAGRGAVPSEAAAKRRLRQSQASTRNGGSRPPAAPHAGPGSPGASVLPPAPPSRSPRWPQRRPHPRDGRPAALRRPARVKRRHGAARRGAGGGGGGRREGSGRGRRDRGAVVGCVAAVNGRPLTGIGVGAGAGQALCNGGKLERHLPPKRLVGPEEGKGTQGPAGCAPHATDPVAGGAVCCRRECGADRCAPHSLAAMSGSVPQPACAVRTPLGKRRGRRSCHSGGRGDRACAHVLCVGQPGWPRHTQHCCDTQRVSEPF